MARTKNQLTKQHKKHIEHHDATDIRKNYLLFVFINLNE